MSVSPRPIKLVIVAGLAAVMVGVALAIVLNYQASVSAQDESRGEMPDIEVLTQEGVVMQRGETKVIPVELRILSKEPLEARIVIFSTDSPESAQEETMSDDGDLEQRFQELGQKGFTHGFRGSLDIETLSAPANSNGDITIETVNLTLTAPDDIPAGNYYFIHSVLAETQTWDFISSSTLEITIS